MKFSGLSLLLTASAANAVNYPVGITNCHYSQWFEKPPERVAVSSSGAVEVMLSLGLADKIVSSAWVENVWEPLMDDFNTFKHYPKYPPAAELKASDPDFLYATYSSAFEDPADPGRVVEFDRLNQTEFLGLSEPCNVLIPSNSYGENKTYCRDEIHEAGMNTYLAEGYCEYADYRPAEPSVDSLYQEIWDLANIFDVVETARGLVDGIEDHFEQALAISQEADSGMENPEPIRVFWLDMFQSKSKPDENRPFVGACCGGPQIVLDKAGAVNVFAEQGLEDRRIWDRVEWDDIVKTDPDLIVLIELSTEGAAEKLYNLCADPVLREMRAVQERQFLFLPFAGSNIGVRLGATAYNMAEAMAAIAHGKKLNSLEFTANEDTHEAVSLSGLKVWTTLPTWNGTDLETFCPGSTKTIEIGELTMAEERGMVEESTGLASWAIALIVVLAIAAVVAGLFVINMVQKEKAGNPMFTPMVPKDGAQA